MELALNDKTAPERHIREFARWLILRMLYAVRPGYGSDPIILQVLQSFDLDYQLDILHQDLDYICSVGLAEQGNDMSGRWARLTALGVAVVEYTTEAASGIGRPRKSVGGSRSSELVPRDAVDHKRNRASMSVVRSSRIR